MADTPPPPDEPIVLLHGFTQTGASWAPLREPLTEAGHPTVTLDLPGHGTADPHHDPADLRTAAGLVADATGPAIYVGYSMGGRVACASPSTDPTACAPSS